MGEHRPIRDFDCPVAAALDVLGGRWKGQILYYLLRGPTRFGALRRLVPGATQRMLTLQLRELEGDGVIHREVYREVPPRVEYSLTPFGMSLRPIIEAMELWGSRYMEQIAALRAPEAQDSRGNSRRGRRGR
jgi:DNA-binding HxlR family transcriptional regulator